jgi:hypothetical protein
MKSAFLIVLATFLALSFQSARAGELLTHSGYVVESGSVSISTNYATFGSTYGELEQTFATVPGKTYIVYFVSELSGSAGAYLDGGISGSSGALAYWSTPSTSYVKQDFAFVASSTSTMIYFYGEDANLELYNTSVTEGSFTKPGTYTGSVTISKAIPVAGISGSHTESLVAAINSDGALYSIVEPSGGILIGGFYDDSAFVHGGTVVPATLSGNNLTFTLTQTGTTSDGNLNTRVTDTEAVSLTFEGN